MDIISRSAAGLPSPSVLSRKTTPWAGITWHHTGGSPTTWRAIHDWQTDGRPAASQLVYIGYSYGIGVDGRVTELRGWDYRAAGDFDNSRLQVVFMGNWATKLPPAPALAAALEFARYAEQRAGRPMPGVAHRDVWPAGNAHDTDCPGNALYAWVRANLITIGDDDMPSWDDKIGGTAYADRTFRQVFQDLSNQRDWEVGKAGDKAVNPPNEQSRAVKLDRAADKVLAAPPVQPVPVDVAALAAALAPHMEAAAEAAVRRVLGGVDGATPSAA